MGIISGCSEQDSVDNNLDVSRHGQATQPSLDSFIYHHPEIFRNNDNSRLLTSQYQRVRMLLEREDPGLVRIFHQNFASNFSEPEDLTPLNFINYCAGLPVASSRWQQLAQRSQTEDCFTPLIASKAALHELFSIEREVSGARRSQLMDWVQSGFRESEQRCPGFFYISEQETFDNAHECAAYVYFADNLRCELYNDVHQALYPPDNTED